MNRPDGITQEAWDAAEQALSSPIWFDGEESPLHEAIAQAIQSAVEAERERCAQVAERFIGQTDYDLSPEAAVSESVTARSIARAIRKGA